MGKIQSTETINQHEKHYKLNRTAKLTKSVK